MNEKKNEPELIERVIKVNRVAKVVKGGRRFSFSALVVVGNGSGKVGLGLGKANEVTEAIRKGISEASRQMKSISLEENTIPHQIIGRYGAGKVLMQPASKGHGIIAAAAVRAVMEAVGVEDITVRSLGSRNPHNLVRATLEALGDLRSFNSVAAARKIPVELLRV